MNRSGHENIKFFIGQEVEHSPAYGHRTLFVVGLQDPVDINQQLSSGTISHIYFGANQSFPSNGTAHWRHWEEMIMTFLQRGYLCTLDLDVSVVEDLTDGPLVEYNNFITMISVKIPNIQMLGYNATIKLDDRDFCATNPGVWCHSLHDLRDRRHFTDWSKYTKDEVIE